MRYKTTAKRRAIVNASRKRHHQLHDTPQTAAANREYQKMWARDHAAERNERKREKRHRDAQHKKGAMLAKVKGIAGHSYAMSIVATDALQNPRFVLVKPGGKRIHERLYQHDTAAKFIADHERGSEPGPLPNRK